MTQIRQISFVNAKGKTVRILLEKEGASFSNQKFPVTGYRFRWQLSEFGFGGLNQIVTLDIFDDGELFDILRDGRRQDVQIRILIGDKELFRGFPDYEQLKRFPKRSERREFQAVFYNPVGFKTEITFNEQVTLDVVNENTGFLSDVVVNFFGGSYRISTLIRSLLREYGKNLLTNHDWTQQENSFVPSGNVFNLYNQTWVNTVFAREIEKGLMFTETCNIVSRSFWFRFGWSYKHQAPLAIKMTGGFNGEYQLVELGNLIVAGTGQANNDDFIIDTEVRINETIVHSPNYQVEEIDDNKLNFINDEVEEKDIQPYLSTTYERDGEERENRPIEFTQTNPDDSILADSFTYDEIPFDIVEDGFSSLGDPVPTRVYTLSGSEADIRVPPPLGYSRGGIFYDLTEINAREHMDIRQDKGLNRSFAYTEILDPMIPYIWDNHVWLFWRGEYDLFREETVVKDSIGISGDFYIPEPEEQLQVFTESGTWDWEAAGEPETVDVLVVAGGGSGGSIASFNNGSGGGGAGGVIWQENLPVSANVNVTVGDGGLGDTNGAANNGENSAFDSLIAIGGGHGGGFDGSTVSPQSGGSGGGATGLSSASSGASGTTNQGNNGGNSSGNNDRAGGGGGGFSEPGTEGVQGKAGDGGDGIDMSAIFGTEFGDGGWFAGGGGGGKRNSDNIGVGGKGGGANGNRGGAGEDAIPNTGGGGGGMGESPGSRGGHGGSGIVIVRWFT